MNQLYPVIRRRRFPLLPADEPVPGVAPAPVVPVVAQAPVAPPVVTAEPAPAPVPALVLVAEPAVKPTRKADHERRG